MRLVGYYERLLAWHMSCRKMPLAKCLLPLFLSKKVGGAHVVDGDVASESTCAAFSAIEFKKVGDGGDRLLEKDPA